MRTDIFDFEFSAGSALDIGLIRQSNEDRVILCPEIGFFAVSDGMGGLPQGGKTSEIVAEVMPAIVEDLAREFRGADLSPERCGAALKEHVRLVSDNIYDTVNTAGIYFGATLSCLWLVGAAAVYVNLGDSRGYLLPKYKRTLRQVTEDHNVAAELVQLGELTREEAQGHPASSSLTQFMGMPAPAQPDVFIEPVARGDRLLLCSDGIHGMLGDREIRRRMRGSKWPNAACKKLAYAANRAGGHDNIAAIIIKII